MIQKQYTGADKALFKVCDELFREIGYSMLCQLLRKKDIKVNGKRVNQNVTLKSGDVISIYAPEKLSKIDIKYEDGNLLIANKPKGIVSDGDNSFEAMVQKTFGDSLRLMHRLDTNTDGLLIFAKNAATYDVLYRAMSNGEITKRYIAEVYGAVSPDNAELKYHFKKDEQKGRANIYDNPIKGSIPVSIIYRVIQRKEATSVLEIEMHSGKMHQIRSMLAHYGHFVIGDGKYGDDRINRMLKVKKQQLSAVGFIFNFSPQNPLFYLNTIKF